MSLLRDFQGFDGRAASLLDQGAKGLGGGDGRRAAERQVAGLR